jgi:hypothetical protein
MVEITMSLMSILEGVFVGSEHKEGPFVPKMTDEETKQVFAHLRIPRESLPLDEKYLD